MIPDKHLKAKASRIEVLSTSKDTYCIASLKVFNILQTNLDLNLTIISKKFLAGILSMVLISYCRLPREVSSAPDVVQANKYYVQ